MRDIVTKVDENAAAEDNSAKKPSYRDLQKFINSYSSDEGKFKSFQESLQSYGNKQFKPVKVSLKNVHRQDDEVKVNSNVKPIKQCNSFNGVLPANGHLDLDQTDNKEMVKKKFAFEIENGPKNGPKMVAKSMENGNKTNKITINKFTKQYSPEIQIIKSIMPKKQSIPSAETKSEASTSNSCDFIRKPVKINFLNATKTSQNEAKAEINGFNGFTLKTPAVETKIVPPPPAIPNLAAKPLKMTNLMIAKTAKTAEILQEKPEMIQIPAKEVEVQKPDAKMVPPPPPPLPTLSSVMTKLTKTIPEDSQSVKIASKTEKAIKPAQFSLQDSLLKELKEKHPQKDYDLCKTQSVSPILPKKNENNEITKINGIVKVKPTVKPKEDKKIEKEEIKKEKLKEQTTTAIPVNPDGTINKDHPMVKSMVYGTLRNFLGGYNDQANKLATKHQFVVQDKGVKDRIEIMSAQAPPPPPPIAGNIPATRLKSEIGDRKEPPLCVQNAMMTKDKKPFTYTPGGIDLSEIKSPRMARRIERNANAPGVGELPVTTPPAQSRPLPPSALAAMQPALPVQVFPSGVPPPPPPPPANAPPPPPPMKSLPTKTVVSNEGVFERPDMTRIIPENPMAMLKKTPRVERKSFLDELNDMEKKNQGLNGSSISVEPQQYTPPMLAGSPAAPQSHSGFNQGAYQQRSPPLSPQEQPQRPQSVQYQQQRSPPTTPQAPPTRVMQNVPQVPKHQNGRVAQQYSDIPTERGLGVLYIPAADKYEAEPTPPIPPQRNSQPGTPTSPITAKLNPAPKPWQNQKKEPELPSWAQRSPPAQQSSSQNQDFAQSPNYMQHQSPDYMSPQQTPNYSQQQNQSYAQPNQNYTQHQAAPYTAPNQSNFQPQNQQGVRIISMPPRVTPVEMPPPPPGVERVYVTQPAVYQHPGIPSNDSSKVIPIQVEKSVPSTPERTFSRQQSWTPNQSNSFKMLQKMTNTELDDYDEADQGMEYGPRSSQQFPVDQMRKLQVSKEREFMNRVKQDMQNFNKSSEEYPRYRGGITRTSFFDDFYGPQQNYQQQQQQPLSQGGAANRQPVVRNIPIQIEGDQQGYSQPNRNFRMNQGSSPASEEVNSDPSYHQWGYGPYWHDYYYYYHPPYSEYPSSPYWGYYPNESNADESKLCLNCRKTPVANSWPSYYYPSDSECSDSSAYDYYNQCYYPYPYPPYPPMYYPPPYYDSAEYSSNDETTLRSSDKESDEKHATTTSVVDGDDRNEDADSESSTNDDDGDDEVEEIYEKSWHNLPEIQISKFSQSDDEIDEDHEENDSSDNSEGEPFEVVDDGDCVPHVLSIIFEESEISSLNKHSRESSLSEETIVDENEVDARIEDVEVPNLSEEFQSTMICHNKDVTSSSKDEESKLESKICKSIDVVAEPKPEISNNDLNYANSDTELSKNEEKEELRTANDDINLNNTNSNTESFNNEEELITAKDCTNLNDLDCDVESEKNKEEEEIDFWSQIKPEEEIVPRRNRIYSNYNRDSWYSVQSNEDYEERTANEVIANESSEIETLEDSTKSINFSEKECNSITTVTNPNEDIINFITSVKTTNEEVVNQTEDSILQENRNNSLEHLIISSKIADSESTVDLKKEQVEEIVTETNFHIEEDILRKTSVEESSFSELCTQRQELKETLRPPQINFGFEECFRKLKQQIDTNNNLSESSISSSNSSGSSSKGDDSEELIEEQKKAFPSIKDRINMFQKLKAQSNEDEDEDSGVTSDMSRHISDNESEVLEFRKMIKYQRAATHSRLHKLLQGEDDEEDTDDVPSEELVNELVKNFVEKKKNLCIPLDKLQKVAFQFLQEDKGCKDLSSSEEFNSLVSPLMSSGNATTAQTPQEFYSAAYSQYYDSWNLDSAKRN